MTYDITNNDIEQPPLPISGLAEEPKHKRDLSDGEKLFDRVTYTGIGLGVNEASSLWITDQFMHGKNLLSKAPEPLKKLGEWFSKSGYERAGDSLGKALKLADKPQALEGIETQSMRGRNSLLMLTLLSGGTLLLLPMKKLEDNKRIWVERANHFLDKIRGSKLTTEEVAARDEKVEQDIVCSPRQSWSSFMWARLAAVSASVLTGTFLVGPKRNQEIMNRSEHLFTGSVMQGEKSKRNRYASLIGVETYSCAISSFVLELVSKFSAKRGASAHDPEMCKSATPVANATSGENNNDEPPPSEKALAMPKKSSSYAEQIRSEQSAQAQAPALV
jgi:hypothetical protein